MKEREKIVRVFTDFLNQKSTHDLADIFKHYMQELHAKPVKPYEKHTKNTDNTYLIDGKSTDWNRVECYYYRHDKDCEKYGNFEFDITMRKEYGKYLLIQLGMPQSKNNRIDQILEISYNEIKHLNEKKLKKFIEKDHPKLFGLIQESLKK